MANYTEKNLHDHLPKPHSKFRGFYDQFTLTKKFCSSKQSLPYIETELLKSDFKYLFRFLTDGGNGQGARLGNW